jgi:hypothetical protein
MEQQVDHHPDRADATNLPWLAGRRGRSMAADQQRRDGGQTREPAMIKFEFMSNASPKLQTGLRLYVSLTAAQG